MYCTEMRYKNTVYFPFLMSFRAISRLVTFAFMNIIRVTDMLKTMQMRGEDREPIPFSITFVTCDLKKDEGGNKITLKEAILVGRARSKSEVKNPNHFANYTRNIRAVNSDKIIKVHALLVTKFNGQEITQ